MSDYEYGPWISTKVAKPENGMIIQVKAIHKDDDRCIIFEGMVEGIIDGTLVMEGMPNDAFDWKVYQWRERKPKGLQLLTDILREVERDGDKVYSGGEMEGV